MSYLDILMSRGRQGTLFDQLAYRKIVGGTTETLIGTDTEPYFFRASPSLGDYNAEHDEIVGASVGFNQLWGVESKSVSNNGITISFDSATGELTVVVPSSPSGACQLTMASAVPTAHKYLAISDKALVGGMEFYSGSIALIGNYGSPQNQAVVANQTSATQSSIYFYVGASTAEGTYKYKLNFIDLTAMLGSTIADYIVTQGDTNGVAFFRKYFGADYYPYSAPTIKSVEGLSAHDTVGFNQFDKSTAVVNSRFNTNGTATANGTTRSDYIKCVPSTSYYFKNVHGSGIMSCVFWYDENKEYIGNNSVSGASPSSGLATSPANASYMGINFPSASLDDVCVNIAWDNSRNGDYEPYELHSYPLDSDLTLRGIPKLDANNSLYYDGDTYESDGTVTRKYKYVTGSELTLHNTSSSGYKTYKYSTISQNAPAKASTYIFDNIGLGRRAFDSATVEEELTQVITAGGGLTIYLSIRSSRNIADVNFIYELATPTTETATPYAKTQKVSPSGTEEYVSTGVVPVGHNTEYVQK